MSDLQWIGQQSTQDIHVIGTEIYIYDDVEGANFFYCSGFRIQQW